MVRRRTRFPELLYGITALPTAVNLTRVWLAPVTQDVESKFSVYGAVYGLHNVLNVIGPIHIEAPRAPPVSRTYASYEVPAVKPVATPVVVVKFVRPVAEGVKPAVPTTRFQVVEPPVVRRT